MGSMEAVGPREIGRILAVTDALGLHREAVQVPLWTEKGGKLAVRNGRLQITAPSDGDFEAWLARLPDLLRATDLSSVRRA
jgi:hypothetical protein